MASHSRLLRRWRQRAADLRHRPVRPAWAGMETNAIQFTRTRWPGRGEPRRAAGELGEL